ncbi:unnamed protein product [Arctogadus glacialis]
MTTLPFPCPVRLGVMKSEGLEEQLHRYTMEKNLTKMEKLLRKGVDVDCINHLGQTPLFCAALLGHGAVSELLLQYRADPNHRCKDLSTPVHAAVFSGNARLLSGLLDSGGDIRLHDQEGRVPGDWLMANIPEHGVCEITEFLQSCASHVHQCFQRPGIRELSQSQPFISTSSKILLRTPSMLGLIKSRGLVQQLHKKSNDNYNKGLCTTAQCFGFGKVCMDRPCKSLGVLASIPLIQETDLTQADDETLRSFSCGSLTSMTNYSWKGSRVTVKQIKALKAAYKDLLLTEQEYCSQLFHPHLLQLMAVSLSADLLKTRLVFERVHVDTLHNLLHHKRAEFPVLHMAWLLPVLLQVCEGVLYLHSRGLVIRALSSHSVVLTRPGLAKLTGFGFMVHRKSPCVKPSVQLDVPPSFYNWAAPEVIKRRNCTEKADLYSLCTIIQEMYTDAVPWGAVDQNWIKQVVEGGEALQADSRVPEPFYALICVGLQPHATERTQSVQDLCVTLRSDIQSLSPDWKLSSSGDWGYTTAAPHTQSWQTVNEKTHQKLSSKQARQQPIQHEGIQSGEEREVKMVEQVTEEVKVDERPLISVLHPVLSVNGALPLDEWCVYPSAPPTLSEGSMHSDSVEDCLEPAKKTDLLTGGRRLSEVRQEQIGSIVLNLKVSQVLLQQGDASLDVVESCLRTRGGNDEVDCREASPTNPSKYRSAVGPPSPRYRRPPRPLAKTLERHYGERPQSQEREREELTFGMAPSPFLKNDCQEYRKKSYAQTNRSSLIKKGSLDIHPRPKHEEVGGINSRAWSHLQDHPGTRKINELIERSCASPDFLEGIQSSLQQMGVQAKATKTDSSSESESDRDFHTVNQTFALTSKGCDDQEPSQEESNSDTDDRHTTLRSCPTVHNPDPKATQSQDPGSEEGGDVIPVVFRPEGCRPEGHLANITHCEEECVLSEKEMPFDGDSARPALSRLMNTTSDPTCLAQVDSDMMQHFTELAELSSITGSPGQHQDGLFQTSLNRPPPPCNSTPRSLGHLKSNPTGTEVNNSPILEAPAVQWTSMSLNSESFTTAAADVSGDGLQDNLVATNTIQSPFLKVDPGPQPPSHLLQSPDLNLAGSTDRAQCPGPGKEQRGAGREAVEGRQEEQHAEGAGPCAGLDEGDRSGQQGDGKGHCVEAAEHAGPDHRGATEQSLPGGCGAASVMNRELKGLLDDDEEGALHKACADQCGDLQPVGGKPSEDPSSLERSDRAHSTLDEALAESCTPRLVGPAVATETGSPR